MILIEHTPKYIKVKKKLNFFFLLFQNEQSLKDVLDDDELNS